MNHEEYSNQIKEIGIKIKELEEKKSSLMSQLDLDYSSKKKELLSAFHKEIENLFLEQGCQIPKTLFRVEGVFEGKGTFALFTYNLVGITDHTSSPSCIHIEYKSNGWLESDAVLYVPEISQDALINEIQYEKFFLTAEEAINNAIKQMRE